MQIYQCDNDTSILDWQWNEPSLRNITELVMKEVPAGGGTALDVGCGTGRISFQLAERGYTVDAIDVEPRVIALAEQIKSNQKVDCNFRVADFRDPCEVRPDYYDLVVCSEVLEHVEDYQPLIDNMYAALKPGGRLIVTVPYDMRKFSQLDVYSGHVRRFELAQMKEDLARFSSTRFIITGFPFYRFMVRSYLWMKNWTKEEHSVEALWDKTATRVIAKLAYPFVRLDNLFSFTRMGDALIAFAKK